VLSYVQFEPEGGGIVVDASEQGLAFHSAAALRQTGPIQLCVSPNPTEQLKLTAEIVWMDETKKSGGLRFTELAAHARNQILQWLSQTSGSEAPAGEFAVPSCALVEETDARLRPGNGNPDQLSPDPGSAAPTGADHAIRVPPRFWNVSPESLSPERFPLERQRLIPWRRLLKGLVTGLLILVFAFMPFFFSRNFRYQIGDSLICIGEKLNDNHGAVPDASSSAPVPSANQNSTSIPSVPNAVPEDSAKESLDQSEDQSDLAASTQTTQTPATATDSRNADRRDSGQHTAHANARSGRSPLARQLWSRLGAGDDSVEVPLAQLYLKGDGVPKNCEQALVLLRAASKNGNIEARQQLRQLGKKPCR
jgi:hypothetical protein